MRNITALVTGYLSSLAEGEAEFVRLEAKQRRVLAEIGQFSGADRLSRDEVHDRCPADDDFGLPAPR